MICFRGIHRFIKLSTITFILFQGEVAPLLAQHDHGGHNYKQSSDPIDRAPHGGMVQPAGKFYVEMVVDMLQMQDKVCVYLLNRKGKTLANENSTGSIVFTYNDTVTITRRLNARGDDHFATQLDSPDAFSVLVTLNFKDQLIIVRFEHGGLNIGNSEQAVYSCPMHPEVQINKSGSCPKCGMNLVKKR